MKLDERKINRKYLMIGGYVSLICLLVAATVIVANILISMLPGRFAKVDTSRSDFFTFTEHTKEMISEVDADIDIYLIAAYGNENPYIRSALDSVCDLNSKIDRYNADPKGDAVLISKYGASSATENSIIVVSGERYKVVDYLDIFEFGVDYENLKYTQSFDFEAEIYAAIEYVAAERLPKAYYTNANGELVFDEAMLSSLGTSNISYELLALAGTVPDDAECVVISNPTKDLTTAQLNALRTYLGKGGKLLLIYNNNPKTDMSNLKLLLADYGLRNNEGVILDTDSSYMFQYNGSAIPYVIHSDIKDEEAVAALREMEVKPIFQLSTGVAYTEGLDGSIEFTELCMSSANSFLRPYSSTAESYSKTEGDIGGPICMAVIASKEAGDGISELAWIASDSFADSSINDFASGGNSSLISVLTAHLTEKESSTARAKIIGYDGLDITSTQRTAIAILLIVVIPALFITYGLYINKKRRMK